MRLWRFDGRGLRVAAGPDPGWSPPIPPSPGLVSTPAGAAWLEPVAEVDGYWLEVSGGTEDEVATASAR